MIARLSETYEWMQQIIAESVTETSCELSLSALLLYWLADQSEASPKNGSILIGLDWMWVWLSDRHRQPPGQVHNLSILIITFIVYWYIQKKYILLPCPSLNLFTSLSVSFSMTRLQISLWMFNTAKEFSLSSPIVDLMKVLSLFKVEKLRSASQLVTGSVAKIFKTFSSSGKNLRVSFSTINAKTSGPVFPLSSTFF